jgi:hypothetical protein
MIDAQRTERVLSYFFQLDLSDRHCLIRRQCGASFVHYVRHGVSFGRVTIDAG